MLLQPLNFIAHYSFDNIKISYEDLHEIVQGGPEVGTIIINNQNAFPNLVFGGPLYYFNNAIYLPKYIGGGFISTSINIHTNEVKSYGNKEGLILIFKVDETGIEYYTDLQNTKIKKLPF
jgi:hypothetical protein